MLNFVLVIQFLFYFLILDVVFKYEGYYELHINPNPAVPSHYSTIHRVSVDQYERTFSNGEILRYQEIHPGVLLADNGNQAIFYNNGFEGLRGSIFALKCKLTTFLFKTCTVSTFI